jgi:UDP-N-acetylglucosamine 3-dehydrogenase
MELLELWPSFSSQCTEERLMQREVPEFGREQWQGWPLGSSNGGGTMRVGLVGGGAMAEIHLRSLLSLAGTEVCGVAALGLMPAVSELCESQAVPVGTSMEWLLGACRPDAIVVATPTDTHAHLVTEAARAGCHAFCEKPLARTAAEAAATLSACQEAGVKLSVGHVVRYFPAYARIAEMVKSGQVGPPGLARCQRVSGPPGATREWYADASRSGGLLLDMAVHDFDWLRWCLGPVQRVSAVTSRADLGEAAMVVLAHVSGAISVVELSWMDPDGFATSVEVSGPNGLVRHDSRRSSTYVARLWPATEGAEPAVRVQVGTSTDDPYRQEVADALSWFGGGPEPRSTGRDAVAAVTLAEAAQLSAMRGEPVSPGEVGPEGAL